MEESNRPEPFADLPLYECRKTVRGAKIIDIIVCPGGMTVLYKSDGGYIQVMADYMAKHKPEIGGYFVAYDDGYTSYSPAKAFEDGYSPLPA